MASRIEMSSMKTRQKNSQCMGEGLNLVLVAAGRAIINLGLVELRFYLIDGCAWERLPLFVIIIEVRERQ